MKRAAFLDLHGTLVLPLAVDHLDELRVIAGTEAAVARLCASGFVCPVVTVQSRIAKGAFSELEFREWFGRFAGGMRVAGAFLAGPYVCPHRFKDPCACKKPQTFLYEKAAKDLDLDLSASFVIGDSLADAEAAYRFGGRGCLLRTGGTRTDEPTPTHASHVAGSLSDAVDWILQSA